MRCLGHLVSVEPHVSPAEIVGHHENDVGPLDSEDHHGGNDEQADDLEYLHDEWRLERKTARCWIRCEFA